MVHPRGIFFSWIPRIIHKQLTSKIESITSCLLTLIQEYTLHCRHTGKKDYSPKFLQQYLCKSTFVCICFVFAFSKICDWLKKHANVKHQPRIRASKLFFNQRAGCLTLRVLNFQQTIFWQFNPKSLDQLLRYSSFTSWNETTHFDLFSRYQSFNEEQW